MPLSILPSERIGFSRMLPEHTGISFSNGIVSAIGLSNRVLENGSGVAAGDVNGDGRCDLFFCGLSVASALYLNLGDWKFEDVTLARGISAAGQFSTGAVLADVDGDRDLDLLVSSMGGGVRVWMNDGKGFFAERPGGALAAGYACTTMCLADIDRDGDLDLYVATYRTTTYKDKPPGVNPEARMVDGKVVVTPADRFLALPVRRGEGVMTFERGEPDFLFLNDGSGRFEPVSWTDGTFVDEQGLALKEAPLEWGLSVMIRDFDGDGSPDIYVCNDFFYSRDQLWLNSGKGKFKAAGPQLIRNMSMSSMAMDVADINRDGLDDFLVVDMLSRDHGARHRQRANLLKGQLEIPVFDPFYSPEFGRNTLYLNHGKGRYSEIAQLSGLDATDWTWGCAFLDVDLDGYEDLLIANGNAHDVLDGDTMRRVGAEEKAFGAGQRGGGLALFPKLPLANLAYRNLGKLAFKEVGASWGFDHVGISHGLALADLDGDGDADVVVNQYEEPALVYRNDCTRARVSVELRSASKNTRAIGARMVLTGFGGVQSRTMMAGGRYVSSDEPKRAFAAADGTDGRLEVSWPSGRRSYENSIKPNHHYVLTEPGEGWVLTNAAPELKPWFEDQSQVLGAVAREVTFDDLRRQPQLPWKLSSLGAGVSWVDLDQDGREDLVVGGESSEGLSWFHNLGQGKFERRPFLAKPAHAVMDKRPVSTLLPWVSPAGGLLLLAAVSNYEDATTNGAMLRILDPAKGTMTDGLRARLQSPGPMAAADIDGDGDLDLFVGGRVLPGRYPMATHSYMYRSDGGRFAADQINGGIFQRLGMVSGAVFTDLDGDGQPELVLSCEWGSLRVFHNDKGRFSDRTEAWGLSEVKGWWNGIAAGDFDGDGRMDLVASNWGRNTKYQKFLSHPLRLYFLPPGVAGESMVLIEAYYDLAVKDYVPWASIDDLRSSLPFLRERFESYRAYGSASIREILGPFAEQLRFLEATTLDSMLFLNRGGRFESRSLPIEAQFAPAFGVSVADFNGDGTQDLFLSQNLYDVPIETSRYDAGSGLILRGDGRGNLTEWPSEETGIDMQDQQRGSAVCDYDQDGRMDLAVYQVRQPCRLYRNVRAQPGLRVRLKGTPQNPWAIGAKVRVGRDGVWGPSVESHSGSGYWSNDGATLVMTFHEKRPSQIMIQWPGGRQSTNSVPTAPNELVITQPQ